MSKETKTPIAFVCQRYGPHVNGGSEQYCRQVAEKLSVDYDVTVYTTCAKDYITWQNHYAPGTETKDGITIKRYPVKKTRNRYLSALVARLLRIFPWHPESAEWRWIDLQGPFCPDLLDALKTEASGYQKVFFMTYLYYTSVKGLMLDLPNAVLIPTLHDEPPAYFRCYDSAFSKAKKLVWLTPEEREFAYRRFPQIKNTQSVLAGIGIDEPVILPKANLLPKEIRNTLYLLYVGRIAESKGCGEMFRYFQRYKRNHPGDLKLVLLGRPVMKIPEDPDILSLGFVDEDVKTAIMINARALVLHSRYESLSMVVLESMMLGRPILVTARSEVLKGHCERSNAGLSFERYEEYEKALTTLMTDQSKYQNMSEKGRDYVRKNYSWDNILQAYRQIIEND